MAALRLALALLSLAYLLHFTSALRICAFNIKSFGDSKLADETAADIIVKILTRYDIALVQEVRDVDLSAVTNLLDKLNSVSKYQYSYEISEPLGRENYKEMYLFIYRTQAVSVEATYQYPDPNNAFSREPFIVKFSAPNTKVREFVLVPLHTPPSEAVAEIDALYDVYLDVIDKWATDNIMFLGDFNADCSYVRKRDWASIRLRTSEIFEWLIPDSADTTVGKSDCAYDRIVVCGSKLKKSVVPNSAGIYDFQQTFKLEENEVCWIEKVTPLRANI
uniref:Deoxyribonuclease n=1 Tax=Pelusios castaneus TaxID=367368 RepID=A0A8C8SV99_9SAUR